MTHGTSFRDYRLVGGPLDGGIIQSYRLIDDMKGYTFDFEAWFKEGTAVNDREEADSVALYKYDPYLAVLKFSIWVKHRSGRIIEQA